MNYIGNQQEINFGTDWDNLKCVLKSSNVFGKRKEYFTTEQKVEGEFANQRQWFEKGVVYMLVCLRFWTMDRFAMNDDLGPSTPAAAP